MKHYIAMAGMLNNLPDSCEVYASLDSAIESITDNYNLRPAERDVLKSRLFTTISRVTGVEYAEIQICNCDEPHIHSDSISPNSDSIAEFYREFDPLVVDGKYKPVISVSTLEYYPEFEFISVDTDCAALKDYLGKSSQDYDTFFAYAENGDYVAVYGMSGTVPYNDKTLDLIYPIYPRDYNAELDTMARIINDRPYQHDICNRCRLVHSIRTSCKMPEAPYYVMAKDKFMSNWKLSNGHKLVGNNYIVVPCASHQEAKTVESWIKNNRTDMSYIRVVKGKPKYRHGVKYSLMMEFRYNALKREMPYTNKEYDKANQ